MVVKKLLISHFYNEEFLLPFWINHHLKIFDHAVLINSNSTDRSVEIINNMAPKWQIINSPNQNFDSENTDKLIMEIEKDFTGFSKIVLNTTEFLLINNEYKFEQNLKNFKANRLNTFITCSQKNKIYIKDLIKEENFGFWDDNYNIMFPYLKFNWGLGSRKRIIHSYPSGLYKPGRHVTLHKKVNLLERDIAYLRWYSLSPWTKEFLNRKLEIQNSISQNDLDRNFSYHHFINQKNLEDRRNYFIKISHEYPGKLKPPFIRKLYEFVRFNLRLINFIRFKFAKVTTQT